mgnify:CR=1 FL=1
MPTARSSPRTTAASLRAQLEGAPCRGVNRNSARSRKAEKTASRHWRWPMQCPSRRRGYLDIRMRARLRASTSRVRSARRCHVVFRDRLRLTTPSPRSSHGVLQSTLPAQARDGASASPGHAARAGAPRQHRTLDLATALLARLAERAEGSLPLRWIRAPSFPAASAADDRRRRGRLTSQRPRTSIRRSSRSDAGRR